MFSSAAIAHENSPEFSNSVGPRMFQRSEIGANRLAEIERKMKHLPDLDVHHHRILSIVEWGSGTARGTVVAASEGVERTSSCSILEQIGNGEFEVVTRGPFCHFVKGPVGHMTNGSGRVKFNASIRQWYDGPPTPITFELIFDAGRNIFCEPTSHSETFKCRTDNALEVKATSVIAQFFPVALRSAESLCPQRNVSQRERANIYAPIEILRYPPLAPSGNPTLCRTFPPTTIPFSQRVTINYVPQIP